ncbi:MAG: hypothetical protein ACRDOK_01665 [Streptosporangiaceae bacterium]
MKKITNKEKIKLNTKLALAAAGLAAGLGLVVLSGCGSAKSPTAPAAAVTHPAQPPTVTTIAQIVGATGVDPNCGPAPLGGVTSSGTGFIGTERIGIDVFPNTAVRNSWAATAANFGIVPQTEGADWAVYKSIEQTATGCN